MLRHNLVNYILIALQCCLMLVVRDWPDNYYNMV